jgi:hypothetical protein
MNKQYYFDFVIVGLLLGIFFVLLSNEVRLTYMKKDIKSIKEYLEPPLPDWNN